MWDSTAINIKDIIQALGAKRSGSGYTAKCPVHQDRSPSLSIGERDGKILLFCHAGCTQEAVIGHLRQRGLWPEQRPMPARIEPRLVCTYEYTDESGQLLHRVARFDPKDFRPQHLNVHGVWANGYGTTKRVPYRLPEILSNEQIIIVEGEKDVETLRSHGFVATTNAGGANGWREEFNLFFSDKQVRIIPDNDGPGLKRAVQIARGVLPLATSVNIIQLDDAKDSTEWFERGHSAVEFSALLEGEPNGCN